MECESESAKVRKWKYESESAKVKVWKRSTQRKKLRGWLRLDSNDYCWVFPRFQFFHLNHPISYMQVQIRREQMWRLGGEKELHQLQVRQRLMMVLYSRTFPKENFSSHIFPFSTLHACLFMCDIQPNQNCSRFKLRLFLSSGLLRINCFAIPGMPSALRQACELTFCGEIEKREIPT